MAFRKLPNLVAVARQAQAAAFKETVNTQPSSDDEQPKPTLFCSLRSLPTSPEVQDTVVTKCHELKVKEMKLPTLLLLTKAVKGEDRRQKFRTI